MANRRVGLWIIGAFGGVGASVALGLSALRRGLTDTTGLVTALPPYAGLDLDRPVDFVVGGHEIRTADFGSAARAMGGARPAYPPDLIEACQPELDDWTKNVVEPPTLHGPAAFVEQVQNALAAFVSAKRLDQLVVVNLASTEPPAESHAAHNSVSALEKSLTNGDATALPISGWYAFAAVTAGFPYVNFTPSCGIDVPTLLEIATRKNVPVAGSDGKTGETLLKTVLAPMFAARNLKVMSWVGHNVLGNRDGLVLSDPMHRASKLRTKDRVVGELLGYAPQTVTTIEYVESLDDWKTAWDHVHFQGFLGVPMSLQFTWQGCDSALAAPLVIDLARLTLLSQRRGEGGALDHLAPFFKNPLGGGTHDFARQTARLFEYAKSKRRLNS